MNVQWLIDKITGFRVLLLLLVILAGFGTLLYFEPVSVHYTECRKTERGYKTVGHEFTVTTHMSRENGVLVCLQQTTIERSQQAVDAVLKEGI